MLIVPAFAPLVLTIAVGPSLTLVCLAAFLVCFAGLWVLLFVMAVRGRWRVAPGPSRPHRAGAWWAGTTDAPDFSGGGLGGCDTGGFGGGDSGGFGGGDSGSGGC